MDSLVIQLAKMTLVVLGIFFTPMITRKFVQNLRLPVAQDMMKWGGLGIAGAVWGSGKFAGASGAAGRGVASFLKREAPSVAHTLIPKAKSWLEDLQKKEIPVISQLAKTSADGLDRFQSGIRKSHLLDEAGKDGLYIPTNKEKQLAKYDPRMRAKVDRGEERLSSYLREKDGAMDPITGHRTNAHVPPDQRIVTGFKVGARILNSGMSVARVASNKFVQSVGSLRRDSSPQIESQSSQSTGSSMSTSLPPSNPDSMRPRERKVFLARVREAQARSRRSMSEIIESRKDRP